MAKATLIVTGVDRLAQQFHSLDTTLRGKTLERALASGGLVLANEMKRRAPFKTGNLRRSIHVGGYEGREEPTTGTDIGGNRSGRDYAEVAVGTNVEYAKYVEVRKPFMRPAFDQTADDVVNEVREAFKDLLRAIV